MKRHKCLRTTKHTLSFRFALKPFGKIKDKKKQKTKNKTKQNKDDYLKIVLFFLYVLFLYFMDIKLHMTTKQDIGYFDLVTTVYVTVLQIHIIILHIFNWV